MNSADLLVGGVAAIAGGLGVAAGLGNWDACYQSPKIQWVIERAGRTGARMFYIAGGSFLVILGIAIACGFALHKPHQKAAKEWTVEH